MVDVELRRHEETWIGFTKLIKWGLISVLVLVVLLAIFLV